MQSLEGGYTSVCANGAFGRSPKGSIGAAVISKRQEPPIKESLPCVAPTESVATTVQQIKDLNRKAAEMTKALMSQLISNIEAAIYPGVKQLSTSPNCFIVGFHTAFSSRAHNLSPDYYSSIRQAQLVKQSLAAPAEKGLDAVFSRLEEMYSKKQVIVSKQPYMLNEQTLGIIADVLGIR